MGMFTTRPEEPTEWAGLPSEPHGRPPAAEALGDQVASAASVTFPGDPVTSVQIDLSPIERGDADGSTESASHG